MELDELKSIWKSQPEPVNEKLTESQIKEWAKGRSRSIVGKMKRSVWLEVVACDLAIIAMAVVIFLTPRSPIHWLMYAVIAIYIPFMIYFFLKLKLLAEFDFGAENIRDNLSRLVTRLDSFLKFYFRSFTLLFIMLFLFGLFTMHMRFDDGILSLFSTVKGTLYLIFYTGICLFFIFYGNAWYLRKLYGNHLDKLKALLRELEGVKDSGT